jgi:hypothetical protein
VPHWTRDRRQQVLGYLRQGMTRSTAAELAGFNRSSLWRLLEREIAFGHQVRQAEADARGRAEALVLRAGESDWRAAAWWLERKYRSEWGQRAQLGAFELMVRAIAARTNVDAERLVAALAVIIAQQMDQAGASSDT